MLFYRGVLIERNYHGYYTAWLDYAGCYIQCDTLLACKRAITDDLKLCIIAKTKNR